MGQGTGKDHLVRYAAPGCQALQDMGISLAYAEIPHPDTHGVELRNGTNDKSMPLMGNIQVISVTRDGSWAAICASRRVRTSSDGAGSATLDAPIQGFRHG